MNGILSPLYLVLAAVLVVLVVGMFFSSFNPVATEILPSSWNETYSQVESWSTVVVQTLPVAVLAAVIAMVVGFFVGGGRRR